MLIFSSSTGVAGTVITGQVLPFAIAIGGNPGVPAFPTALLSKAILTGFRSANRSGLGVVHTLLDRIYVYVFGERAGQAEISGIAFAGMCDSTSTYTGFDSLYAYYERVRASSQGLAVNLVFGPETSLYGFMTDFDFTLDDPQTGIGTFVFKFITMPRVLTFGQTNPLPWE